jgi:hypothetical protein
MRNLILISFFVTAITVSDGALAQFGGLKNPLSGALDSGQSSADQASAASSQDALTKRFNKSLINILAAQEKLASAFGISEDVAAIDAKKNLLAGSNNPDDYKRALAISESTQDKINEEMKKQDSLDAQGKAKYVEALPLYARGTYNMVKLGPEASKWIKSAQNEIKGAGLMGMASLKKKLDVGLFIAPKVPGLIKSFTAASGQLVSYGKSNDIDTSSANEHDFDDE